MTPAEVLARAQKAGVIVEVYERGIGLYPYEAVTAEIVTLFALHKAEVMNYLMKAQAHEAQVLMSDTASPDSPKCWPEVRNLDAPMNAGEIEIAVSRMLRFGALLTRMGEDKKAAQASELAHMLTNRDRAGDRRSMCLECANLCPDGKCSKSRPATRGQDGHGKDMVCQLQRCKAFNPAGQAQGGQHGPNVDGVDGVDGKGGENVDASTSML